MVGIQGWGRLTDGTVKANHAEDISSTALSVAVEAVRASLVRRGATSIATVSTVTAVAAVIASGSGEDGDEEERNDSKGLHGEELGCKGLKLKL